MSRVLRDRRHGVVYPGGQVWLGKWIVKEGYTGPVTVLNTNGAVMILKPGMSRHDMLEGMRTVVREIENGERLDDLVQGVESLNGPEIDGLDFVIRRLVQMTSEVELVKRAVMANRKDKDGEKVEHGIEVDTEPEHGPETGGV